MAKVVLFGTGRGADVAYRFLSRDSGHEVCAFAPDRKYFDRATFHGLPVVPFEEVERHYPPDEYLMFILLGYQDMNGLRATKYSEAKRKGYRLATYVSSDIFRVEDIQVGENCFILDNQSISLDVKIGNNVVMWSSNHIGDLSIVEDHAWLASHVTIAADVVVGEGSFLGIGATISNGARLGRKTFVGAHALITSNTPEGSVYVATESQRLDFTSGDFMRVMRAKRKL